MLLKKFKTNLFLLVLTGCVICSSCTPKVFVFMNDTMQISKIEIIRINGYDLQTSTYQWDVLYTEENNEHFVEEFLLLENKKTDSHYPLYFQYNAIFIHIIYINGDEEFISRDVQLQKRKNGMNVEQHFQFKEEEYNAFLNKHISDN